MGDIVQVPLVGYPLDSRVISAVIVALNVVLVERERDGQPIQRDTFLNELQEIASEEIYLAKPFHEGLVDQLDRFFEDLHGAPKS